MLNSELDNFTDALAAIFDIYGKSVSPMAQNIWWESLKEYDLQAVNQAFSRHVTNTDNGQFAPKPADIIRHIEGSTVDNALLAWSKVDNAVKRVGPYQTVIFDDPIIHIVLRDMGGWIELNNKTTDEWPFIANEFSKRYRGAATRENLNIPSKLVGIAEHHNTEAGQDVEPPVLIGDEEKAKQVFLSGGKNKAISVTSGLKLKGIPK